MKKHLTIRVEGRVQGVFFRQSTCQEANKLGLTGTVQNLSDGSVEIHAEGEENKLHELLKWCKEGPSHANVEFTNHNEEPLKNFQGFRIT